VELHPLWIIFGLLAGGSILGFLGLVLAIPLTAITSVLIKHYVKKYKTSEYYED
jgi:predicted PurR-regulated permease PerM